MDMHCRRTGTPRDQRLCQHCTLHAIHDERHLVLECPAMQPVRDHYPALFSPGLSTMQLFMWQPDIVGVAHYILDCFDLLVPCLMLLMMRQPHLHQPWRLDRCKTFIHDHNTFIHDHSFIHSSDHCACHMQCVVVIKAMQVDSSKLG